MVYTQCNSTKLEFNALGKMGLLFSSFFLLMDLSTSQHPLIDMVTVLTS